MRYSPLNESWRNWIIHINLFSFRFLLSKFAHLMRDLHRSLSVFFLSSQNRRRHWIYLDSKAHFWIPYRNKIYSMKIMSCTFPLSFLPFGNNLNVNMCSIFNDNSNILHYQTNKIDKIKRSWGFLQEIEIVKKIWV